MVAVLAVALLSLVAEAATDPLAALWAQVAAQLGGAAVLFVLLWQVLFKQLPEAEKRHRDDRERWLASQLVREGEWRQERAELRAEQSQWRETIAKRDEVIVALLHDVHAQNKEILTAIKDHDRNSHNG